MARYCTEVEEYSDTIIKPSPINVPVYLTENQLRSETHCDRKSVQIWIRKYYAKLKQIKTFQYWGISVGCLFSFFSPLDMFSPLPDSIYLAGVITNK